jgi:hypothetical protein
MSEPEFAALRAPSGATLTTFTVVRYPPGRRLWGLAQMGLARRPLAATPGLRFWKLLGSGAGFTVRPDLSRYALLATWSSEAAADEFLAGPRVSAWRQRASELWTVKLLPRQVRGAWGGDDPFGPRLALPGELPLVVLTRASLRLRALPWFWSRAAAIDRQLRGAPGLRLALGVGELPWIRPVTFSVWDPGPDMERFALRGLHHDAARAARARAWFREDLFARFAAIASQGRVDGRDPCGPQPVLADMAA